MRRWSDGAEHAIDFGETPGIVEVIAGLEQRGRRLRYTYQSMSQPKQVFDYDLESRERVLVKVDGFRAAMLRSSTLPAVYSRRPTTARRFPSPYFIGRIPSSTVRTGLALWLRCIRRHGES